MSKSPSLLLWHLLPPFCHSIDLCGSVSIFSLKILPLSEHTKKYLFVVITKYIIKNIFLIFKMSEPLQ